MEENATNYQEWIEKIHKAAGVAEQAAEKVIVQEKKAFETSIISRKNHKIFFILFGLFILALIPRLYFIFIVSSPENGGVGWNGDTYHHWQIGYLTYMVGLHHGFLRLWDLKGMEYFWGPLDPLLLTAVFAITGSVNLVITRLLSAFFGAACLCLLFLLGKRYFGIKVGIAAFVFGVFFPIAIQSDASGMLEPFGIFFLLLGIFVFPKHAFLAGVSWALAAMVRAEAWFFSLGLLIGTLFLPRTYGSKKLAIWSGWGVVMLVYMKYLLDATGNPIYPIYWNFLANGLGTWADTTKTLSALQTSVKPVLEIFGIVSAGILLFIIWKKPKSMLLLLLGFGNIFFVTAFIGFSHYIAGWEWWFPLIRFFVFSYIFIALLVFAGVYSFPKLSEKIRTILLILVSVAAVVFSQWTWKPVMLRWNQTVPEWNRSILWGKAVGAVYKGGTVLFPEGDPNFTYTAVAYGHIDGTHILGEMYDPFFYIGEDTAFANWTKHKHVINSWLRTNNVSLMIVPNDRKRYFLLRQKEPAVFRTVGIIPNSNYQIWKVNQENIPLDAEF